MNTETLGLLMDKWMNDVSFREEVRRNPESAIERTGVTLSEEDRTALNNIDWSLSDEALQSRISKGT